MTTLPGRIALSVHELARRVGVPLGTMQAILDECEAAGTVEKHGDRYALTFEAERLYGVALRDVSTDCCATGCSRCVREHAA